MFKKIFLTLLLILIPAISNAEITTKAQYAYMIDYDTGSVLFEKNAHEKMIPASMTKLMTATIVFDSLKKGLITNDTEYKVSANAWKKKGSRMFVKYNSSVKVEDLIRGVIVQSGNDACVVLAEGIAGSEEGFVERMNEMGKKLGLENTHFLNSNGLPDLGHHSTTRDLALIAKNIIKNFPEYYNLYSMKSFYYNKIRQYNRNKLLGKFGVDGMKTGFTDESGYGVVLSAKKDDRRVILVINGLASVDARTKEGQKLILYGLNNFVNKKVYTANSVVTKVDIAKGKEAQVNLIVKEDVLETFSREKIASYKFKAKYKTPLIAPVLTDTQVGSFEIYDGEKLIRTVALYPEKNIERISKFREYLGRPLGFLSGGI